jgi:type IV pilus biogenesis protein CpaD/CtpE
MGSLPLKKVVLVIVTIAMLHCAVASPSTGDEKKSPL